MNRVFYYILLCILIGGVSGFLFRASFTLAVPDTVSSTQTTTKNTWYRLDLAEKKDGDADIAYTEIKKSQLSVLKSDTLLLNEFGRLSSIIYLSQSGATSFPIGFSGKLNIVLKPMRGIISLYDLFSQYTLHSVESDFRIEQVTNGSFYLGNQEDGHVDLYAIDSVIRLIFLSNGEEMTSMMLFPGSYIRFDPRRNKELRGTDLFQTILSLDPTQNEVFEFINPRVSTQDQTDTFFNYRLPLQSKLLFRALASRFHGQVESVDILKQYGSTNVAYFSGEASPWLYNPSKKNHIMLQELRYILSQILQGQGNADALVARIGLLYKNSKTLSLESSSARATLENFLLDGRFALYGNSANIGEDYQKTYERIAQIIGIEPTAGKSRLLQNLSDIYSGNLFLQNKKTTAFRINTFDPTATALRATLKDTDIESKDFFDISVYAYNILEKIQEKGVFTADMMSNRATYDFLITFFYASDRYFSSITDTKQLQDAMRGFIARFTTRLLDTFVNTLYQKFFEVDKGFLYLQKSYLDGDSVKVDPALVKNIRDTNTVIQGVFNSFTNVFGQESDSGVLLDNVKKSALRLDMLVTFIDPNESKERYTAYLKNPIFLEEGALYPLPRYLAGTGLITKDMIPTSPIQKISTGSLIKEFPGIDELGKYFSGLTDDHVLLDDGYVRIKDAQLTISDTGSIQKIVYISFVYKTLDVVSQIIYTVDNRRIEIAGANMDLYTAIHILDDVLPRIREIIDSHTDLDGLIRYFPERHRLDIGDTSFSLTESIPSV